MLDLLLQLGRYRDAVEDFDKALQLRKSLDPYILASRGFALVHAGESHDGFLALDESIDYAVTHASQIMPAASVQVPLEPDTVAPLPSQPTLLFQIYFLRGMAVFWGNKTL